MAPPAVSQYLMPSGVYDSDSDDNEDEVDNSQNDDHGPGEPTGEVGNNTAELDDSPKSTSTSGGTIVVKPRQTASAPLPSASPRISPSSDLNTDKEYVEVRVGPRIIADDEADIPTYCIIVARIDPIRGTLTWLGVDTWILNGLRIGDVELADSFKDTEKLESIVEFDVDPFYSARGVLTAEKVRAFLLKFAKTWNGETVPEVLDAKLAWNLRCMAVQHRMRVESDGFDGDAEAEDPMNHFTAPWSLPVQLNLADERFPAGIPGFRSRYNVGEKLEEVHVVATFINDLERDVTLGLPHHVHLSLQPDETLQQVRSYFLDGDAGFAGLKKNRMLKRSDCRWALELWVLPQVNGSAQLYRWDDVPSLCASGFVAQKSMCADADEKAMLYIEARIVD